MRWPWQRESRASGGDFAQALLDAQLAAAAATTTRADQTSDVEIPARALSHALAGATVEGDGLGVVTPEWLALCGHEIIRRGEHVSFIHPSMALVPVNDLNWEIESEQGELERDWRARITTYGPSASRTRVVSRDQLVVVRWAATSGTPHVGRGPRHFASLAARASAESERAAGDDQATPVAPLITVPAHANQGGEDDRLKSLRTQLANGRGKPALVPTVNEGFGEGRGSAPQRDWNPTRLGPAPSPDQVESRKDIHTHMLAAAGMPIAMFSATTAQSAREGLRQWTMGVVMPICKLLGSELSRRLDAEIRIMPDTYGLDLQGRAGAAKAKAGAIKTLMDAGLTLEQAKAEVAEMFPDD
ncbi:MAG: hypothetical protein OXF66_02120 [Gammaproteobacteria bacterium]|nr:hypothetical protein [Gammaproteobacteria bacterium]